jgi:tRNA pseudouridine(55) synthase
MSSLSDLPFVDRIVLPSSFAATKVNDDAVDAVDGLASTDLVAPSAKRSRLSLAAFADSIIAVHKPLGWSSMDVLRRLKGVLRQQKMGFAGTLDPLATGLMIICIGSATKLIQQFADSDKTYTGHIALGAKTPSLDCATMIDRPVSTTTTSELQQSNDASRLRSWISARTATTEQHLSVSESLVDDALRAFNGPIQQKVPVFSAVHKDGQRLYEKAHKGEAVAEEELPVRPVTIHEFKRTGALEALFAVETKVEKEVADAEEDANQGQVEAETEGKPSNNKKKGGKRGQRENRNKGKAATYNEPIVKLQKDEVEGAVAVLNVPFVCSCTKGTYIRSLARDVGEKLETGAFLSSLCRTKVGPFDLEKHAWTMEALEQLRE